MKAGQLGDGGWVRTTDLARIDDDGFLWILGRADQAIIRGGFKVLPEDIQAALERHPAVRGAAVVGRDDRRLGAVPVAAVELRAGAEPVTADDLLAHAGTVLARYELPTEIRIVDELPAHRLRQGRPRRRRARSSTETGADVDLRYSEADEAFRKEVRAWLDEAVAAYGPPPPPGRLGRPPRLRHRLAAPAPRRRLRRAQLAGRVRRPRAARLPAAGVPRGVRRRRARPTSASTSSATPTPGRR